jgi:hypothetical protein
MGNQMPPAPPPIIRCEACFKEVVENDVYCSSCGYPLKGALHEQQAFVSKINKADFDLVAFKKRIKKAGRALFYLSGIFIAGAIFSLFKMKDDPDITAISIRGFIIGAIFLVLAEYSKKKMLACFISGLCLFVIVQLINILSNPEFDLYYAVFIVAIIVYLVIGIKSAIEIEKIKKEHNLN